MSKFIGFSLLLVGAANFAFAGAVRTPEIDGASALAGVALLSGGLLVLRARRKK
jgi:LPXTG-motif cell wall-anchored protein